MKNVTIVFSKGKGLIPAVIQDYKSGIVYMLGFMNKTAFNKTKETGYLYLFSRSRKCLWKKGEKSGNTLIIKDILVDCDNDTLLVKTELKGKNVCHMGGRTCFNTKL